MSSEGTKVLLKDLVGATRGISYGIVQPGPETIGGTPIIRVCDMGASTIDLASLKRVSPSIAQKFKRTELRGGELLISVVGTPGICMIAGQELKGCNLARAVAMVPIEDPLIRQWCRYYILSAEGQAYIEQNLNTTVQKTLNLKELSYMPIPIFNRNTIAACVTFLETIESKIRINQQTNDYLAA